MSEDFTTRLRFLRDQIGITQDAFAKRTALSLAYIKKLERGKKPMSKRPAQTIAVATGVDWRWLIGKGQKDFIPARFGLTAIEIAAAQGNKEKPFSNETRALLAEGIPWKKEMAETIQKSKLPKNDLAEKQEEKLYRLRHHVISGQLGFIIQAAIKQKRAPLCISKIEDFVRELAAEPWLKLKPNQPTKPKFR